MERHEKKDFQRILRSRMTLYRVTLTDDVVELWYRYLRESSLAEICQAFDQHCRQCEKAPTPKHILELLRHPSMDWWSSDIAWARIPKSEDDAAVVNDEMLQAWVVVGDLWADGDKLGARLAFSRTYDDLVAQARGQGRTPAWFLTRSSGDERANQRALIEAADWGVLSPETAKQQADTLRITDGDPIQNLGQLIEAMPQEVQANAYAGRGAQRARPSWYRIFARNPRQR